ncbi:MAG: hypothetical protein ACRC6V_09245 [Bacteroidales bacterium]
MINFEDIKLKLALIGFILEESNGQIYSHEVLEGKEYAELSIRTNKYGDPYEFTLFKENNTYFASDISSNQSSEDPVLAILGFFARAMDLNISYLGRL